ncbi:MAG: CYTH domain-containing protein, partial [Planctomycetota bacterium]
MVPRSSLHRVLPALTLALAGGLALPVGAFAQSQEDETDAHGYDKLRIEQEDKLLVPAGKVDEVWAFLEERLVRDVDFLRQLDPTFTSTWSEELFHDTYFDTPTLQLHAMRSGVRHRSRVNLSNPADRKSGRQLMQIKRNDISANRLERGEIKFEIEPPQHPNSEEDRHPMLGRVKPEHREPFKQRLAEMGLDPQRMKPILTVRDVRRRVYILRDGKPFMSVSFDQASSDIWWARTAFCEIEPELNEIGFTEADEETRAYMETVLAKVVADIRARFPSITQDLTPKYN